MDFPGSNIKEILKKGYVDEFGQLFSKYYPVLYVYSRRYITNTEEAKDIVQNVFLNIWDKRKTIEIKISFEAYLHKAVSNACLNSLKHQDVKNQYAGEFSKRILEAESQSSFQGNDPAGLIEKEMFGLLQKAMDELPENCEKVFKLSRISGMKNKEIASKLNISVRTVETQIYRALKVLREKLKNHLPSN